MITRLYVSTTNPQAITTHKIKITFASSSAYE